MSKSGARILDDAQQLIAAVRAGRGTVGRLFTDDELYRNLTAAVGDAQKAVASVREVADQARDALKGAGGPGGQVATLTTSVTETMAKARDSMANLADATEAMKHNFLLRGYFNQRGYFTLADLSPSDYRRGALEANGRRVLRVWLSADVLFDRDASGAETLTPEGKARLDSAMGPFVPYRQEGPLVRRGVRAAGRRIGALPGFAGPCVAGAHLPAQPVPARPFVDGSDCPRTGGGGEPEWRKVGRYCPGAVRGSCSAGQGLARLRALLAKFLIRRAGTRVDTS